MKLGEALAIRADLLRHLASLKERLQRNAIVQEGDQPRENPEVLLDAIADDLTAFEAIAFRINQANMTHSLPDGALLTAALAHRDVLMMHHAALQVAVKRAEPTDQFFRHSQSEIKWVAVVDIPAIQKQADDISRQIRKLNIALQEVNWRVEL